MLGKSDCAIAQLHFSGKVRFGSAIASTGIRLGVVFRGFGALLGEKAIALQK